MARRLSCPEPVCYRSDGNMADREVMRDGGFAAIVATARLAWPTVDLDEQVFAAYLAARLPAARDGEHALAQMHCSDLYLACACAAGDPHALVAFEATCLAVADRPLLRLGIDAEVVTEVKQRLRRALFVADGGPAKITKFMGRGELRRWIQVLAVREAMTMFRQAGPRAAVDDDGLNDIASPADDPEVAYLKREYRGQFRIAFGEALRKLPDRQRLLLRQHFVDGLTIIEVARLHRVHRVTMARWLDQARAAVLAATRASLAERLDIADAELDSLMGLIRSQLDVSLGALRRRKR